MNDSAKEIFLSKPECVINFPERILSQEKIQAYRTLKKAALVEMAGRDSVAAAIKAVEEESFTDLIPTYVYTGTEHGPWSSVERAVARLRDRLPAIPVHDLLVFGSPRFWQSINGRFISELIARFGSYAPCAGCHLYLHAVRVPLAVKMGGIPIIAGEREMHDDRVKINQTAEALNAYQETAGYFGIRLLLPLRHVKEGKAVEEILGFDWEEGGEQLECVLSGNYRMIDRGIGQSAELVSQYLEKFAVPCAKRIIDAYANGTAPNHLKIAETILKNLKNRTPEI
jgi:hypothetical protein